MEHIHLLHKCLLLHQIKPLYVYVFMKALGREERSHMEGARQVSQQGGVAKVLNDFCFSVGADWQWTILISA